MSSVTFLFLLAVLLLSGSSFAEHHFLPAVKQKAPVGKPKPDQSGMPPTPPRSGPVVMGMGMTVRQEDKKKPICAQFFLSYAQVQKVTLFLRRTLAPAEAKYQRCKKCVLCFGCDDPRNKALVKGAQKCIRRHGFSACAVAVSLLGRDDDISYTCRFYLKESRIGNCYALEYLLLNGYKAGKNNQRLVFNRETGIYDKKLFQCRAGKRSGLPTPKNTHECRKKFRVSPQQINAVASCAFADFIAAGTEHSSCLAFASDIFAINSCYINYVYKTNLAYINCIVPHGLIPVAVASLAIGRNAIGCPVLRRDSYVGPCKAPDFVNLVNLDEVEVKARYLKVMLSGACNYKK